MGRRFYKPPEMVDYRFCSRQPTVFLFADKKELFEMKYICDQCGYIYDDEKEPQQSGRIDCPECGNCIRSGESNR